MPQYWFVEKNGHANVIDDDYTQVSSAKIADTAMPSSNDLSL